MIDVVIFAVIAAFVVIKLRKILGNEYAIGASSKADSKTKIKKKELSNKQKEEILNILIKKTEEGEVKKEEIADCTVVAKDVIKIDEKIQPKVDEISKVIENFNINNFVNGVKSAFVYLWEMYSAGDMKKISEFCKPAVLNKISNIFDENKTKSVQELIHIVKIEDIAISNINILKTKVSISLDIKSLQINYTKDSEDKVVEGSKSVQVEVTESWTFEKKIANKDSEWFLTDIVVH